MVLWLHNIFFFLIQMCSYIEEVTVVQQEVMIFCSFVAEVSEKNLY
jgi:hypothetical protein